MHMLSKTSQMDSLIGVWTNSTLALNSALNYITEAYLLSFFVILYSCALSQNEAMFDLCYDKKINSSPCDSLSGICVFALVICLNSPDPVI